MAALQKIGETYYCKFMYAGARRTFTIGKVAEGEAYQWCTRTDQLLMRIKQGFLQVPDGVDVAEFIRLDGKVPVDPAITARKQSTLHELREAYVTAAGNGAIEKNTLYTAEIHLDHLETALGKNFILSGLTLGKLQDYLTKRAKKVAAVTIKKEVDTFRAVWNWGMRMKWVEKPFPSRGLLYPKTDEKLPFMDWKEIARRIKASDTESAFGDSQFSRPSDGR